MGAFIMVVGSGANVFGMLWAPYLFAVGALAFVLMQLKQGYEGTNTTIHRLRGIVVVSDMFFLAAAFLMFASQDNMLGLDYAFYVQYIHNNWVVALLVGAILQLYTSMRLDKELKKENKND